jgi:WD40 repeat protein
VSERIRFSLLTSSSKDKHIRLWDAVGGVCVQTMTAHVGEVTSVEFDREGKYLLAGCKDNSNRLWDLRMVRLLSTLPSLPSFSSFLPPATFY